jgi:hypothetical protein
MNSKHDLYQFALPEAPAMRRSHPVQVDGVVLGATVTHELGVRFIAVDVRVAEMDQSIWPSLDYAEKSARQLLKSARPVARF